MIHIKLVIDRGVWKGGDKGDMPPEIAQLIFWLEGKDFVIFNQIDSIFFVFWGALCLYGPRC